MPGVLSDGAAIERLETKIGSGPPSPKVVPLQEPLVFHNDFSKGTVALHASGMNRTKVPVHVSKVLRTSPEIVSCTRFPGHARAGFAPCRIRANGGGGRTRTYDLRIMSSEPPNADKEDKGFSSAESGKVLQNPQPPRNQEHVIPSTKPAEQEGRTAESTQPLPDSGVRPREE